MDQNSGVVINYSLIVNSDFAAQNIYNKTDVDYIASTKQSSITASSSFNANKLTVVSAITASYLTATGAVSGGSITTAGNITASRGTSKSKTWII